MVSPRNHFGPALDWIVTILDAQEVPYQVVGGLAAHAHGGSRPLNDIDLYAPLAGRHGLLQSLAPRTVWGPERFRDEAWDLVFMKLDFNGVRIEIGDSAPAPRYFDRQRSRWADQVIDFDASERISVFDVCVSVMPLQELLGYKAALGREVDLIDIKELTGA